MIASPSEQSTVKAFTFAPIGNFGQVLAISVAM
jgi:hypothetical protein